MNTNPLVVFVPVYRHIIELEKEKEKMLERIDLLTGEIQSIDHQLSCAIEKKVETGEYADVKWFMSAKNAKKAKRAEIHSYSTQNCTRSIQRSRPQEVRLTKGSSLKVAKDALSEEQYKTICRLAFDRMGKLEQYAKE